MACKKDTQQAKLCCAKAFDGQVPKDYKGTLYHTWQEIHKKDAYYNFEEPVNEPQRTAAYSHKDGKRIRPWIQHKSKA